MSYAWVCHVCGASNTAEAAQCGTCASPQALGANEMEKRKRKWRGEKEKPEFSFGLQPPPMFTFWGLARPSVAHLLVPWAAVAFWGFNLLLFLGLSLQHFGAIEMLAPFADAVAKVVPMIDQVMSIKPFHAANLRTILAMDWAVAPLFMVPIWNSQVHFFYLKKRDAGIGSIAANSNKTIIAIVAFMCLALYCWYVPGISSRRFAHNDFGRIFASDFKGALSAPLFVASFLTGCATVGCLAYSFWARVETPEEAKPREGIGSR